MSDYSELKRLAEAATPGPWAYDGSYVCPARTEDGTTYVELWRSIADCHQPENTKFIAAANPAAVLALIAEVEGLRKLPTAWSEVYEQSDELDALRDEKLAWLNARDQLKAEVEKLRKDAERLDWLCGQSRPVVEGQTMNNPEGELAGYDWGVFGACGTVREAIDYAMSKGDQP